MSKVILTWITANDDRVCPICKDIDGYQWIFDTESGDIMTDALFHPVHGIVWSLEQGSNAHAHGYLSGRTYGCRCKVDHNISAEDVLAKSVYLAELAQDAANAASDTKTGSYRTTRPEDIGIDLSKYGIK